MHIVRCKQCVQYPEIERLVRQLAEHRCRATYKAAAEYTGLDDLRAMMEAHDKDKQHSWIVNAGSGVPTGYLPTQMGWGPDEKPSLAKKGAELDELFR